MFSHIYTHVLVRFSPVPCLQHAGTKEHSLPQQTITTLAHDHSAEKATEAIPRVSEEAKTTPLSQVGLVRDPLFLNLTVDFLQ